MRKFTKEISALLASATVGAAVYAGTVYASSEQMEPTAGVMANPDEIVETATEEYLPPEAGEMLSDDLIEPAPEPTAEEDFPPTAGVPMEPDDLIEPTELPPLAGEPMPPDEWIESTTEEELPPLAGDIAPADGDINGDGIFGVSDVVLLQKWLLKAPDTHLTNWWAADFNYDNTLNVFDLCLMKKALIYTFD